MLPGLTIEEVQAALNSGDEELAAELQAIEEDEFLSFQPRSDAPNEFDEQTAAVESDAKFVVLQGGTGSGKTAAAAWKTARYLRENIPPIPGCLVWVIGETMDQVCEVCWKDKLSHFIPQEWIRDFRWYDSKRKWPHAVILKHPKIQDEDGWIIEFKSYAEGLRGMKGARIGWYWFNEECPYSIVEEVQGRCREWDSPGIADFTPIECKDPKWPELYRSPPTGWKFYHLNTMRNAALPEGWAKRYLEQVPEEMRDLRQYGFFTSLKGAVYKEFSRERHVIKSFGIPEEWFKCRAIDFGFNNAFVCLWFARDPEGRYYIYDEHYAKGESNDDHAAAILGQGRWSHLEHRAKWPRGTFGTYGRTWSDHDAQQRREMMLRGILCTPANKEKQAGETKCRSLMMIQPDMRPRLHVFEHCKNLIREIVNLRYADATKSHNAKEESMDLDNDTTDCMRYGVFSEEVMRLGGGKTHLLTPVRQANRHGVLLHRSRMFNQ